MQLYNLDVGDEVEANSPRVSRIRIVHHTQLASAGELFIPLTVLLVVQSDKSLLESSDGLNWQLVPGAPPLEFTRMVAGNGVLLGFDEDTFYRSADGLSWTEINQEDEFNPEGVNEDIGMFRYRPEIEHVEFSGGKFVGTMIRDILYENNTYAVSTDGLIWTFAEAPPYEVDEDSGTTGFSNTVGGGGGGDSLRVGA